MELEHLDRNTCNRRIWITWPRRLFFQVYAPNKLLALFVSFLLPCFLLSLLLRSCNSGLQFFLPCLLPRQ